MEAGPAALDEGTLSRVFAFLTLEERHRTLALVCRRWRQLLYSTQLLHSVAITRERLVTSSEPAMRSLCSWLQHHAAPHVQRLEIKLAASNGHWGGAMQFEDLHEQFVASLVACGAAGQLTSLHITIDCPLWLRAGELGALTSLRSLRIHAFQEGQECEQYDHDSSADPETVHLDGAAVLTALQDLCLGGDVVGITDPLPLSLTSLHVDGFCQQQHDSLEQLHCLPRQMEELTALRTLALARVYSSSPDDYRQLSQLRQLDRLSLQQCTHLPACLSKLTTLRVLRLYGTPHGWFGQGQTIAATLGAALRPLLHLRHLVLRDIDCLGSGLPLELAGLSLERFYWLQQHDKASGQLPAGPWLGSLRQVVLSVPTAAANLRVLSAAQHLEALAVVDTLGCDNARSRYEFCPAVAAFANGHPSLRRLGICPSELPWLAEKYQAWKELRTRVAHLDIRPSLSIEDGTSLMCELGFMASNCTDTF
ncbi:hypothetical protein D9Q98_010098 [Chlorella vulgaris]|uniref:F-box domain-containing protein n=1 Tax=Chlorella vulgaris TaxID=3077 RepID=A0A9D4TN32_CHLVU|nr:hypothetical protein D9Q98_010098 [Chlorella vulgaris]